MRDCSQHPLQQRKTYRLQSSSLCYAPGIVRWAINGYAFEKDRARLLSVITETWKVVSLEAAKKLLSGEALLEIDGETVVFSVEEGA